MRKLNKLVVAMTLATVTLFSACSEKETPVPTVNNERLDALRIELRQIQEDIYGPEGMAMVVAETNADNADLTRDVEALEAEITRLMEVFQRSVNYGIYVTDFQNNKIEGATVKIAQDGEVVSGTTDAKGYVMFEDIRSGYVTAVIEAAGFTSANIGVAFYEYGSYTEDEETYKSSKLALFPISADKGGMFTLKGKLLADYDATDAKFYEDFVADQKLTFNVVVDDIKDDSEAFSANIQSLVYEGAIFTTTTTADGSYEISLPARSVFSTDMWHNRNKNFGYTVEANDFRANYKYEAGNGDEITEERIFRFDSDNVNAGREAVIPGETRTKTLYYDIQAKN